MIDSNADKDSNFPFYVSLAGSRKFYKKVSTNSLVGYGDQESIITNYEIMIVDNL